MSKTRKEIKSYGQNFYFKKKHYEIFDTQMEELIESRNNEYEIKEQDLRAEVEKAVKEYQPIGDDKEDIYYQYNGEKTWMPATVFYDYIKKADINEIIKMKFVFLGFIGNSTDFESAEITIEEKKTIDKVIIIQTKRMYDNGQKSQWSETNIVKKILTEQQVREWLEYYFINIDEYQLTHKAATTEYTRNQFIDFVKCASFERIIETEYNVFWFDEEDCEGIKTNIRFKKLDN